MSDEINDTFKTIEPVEIIGLSRELRSAGMYIQRPRDFAESLVEAADNAEMLYLSKNPGEIDEYLDEGGICPYCTTDFQEALKDSLTRRGFLGEFFVEHPYLLIRCLGDWGVLLGYEGSKERVRLSQRWESKLRDYLLSEPVWGDLSEFFATSEGKQPK